MSQVILILLIYIVFHFAFTCIIAFKRWEMLFYSKDPMLNTVLSDCKFTVHYYCMHIFLYLEQFLFLYLSLSFKERLLLTRFLCNTFQLERSYRTHKLNFLSFKRKTPVFEIAKINYNVLHIEAWKPPPKTNFIFYWDIFQRKWLVVANWSFVLCCLNKQMHMSRTGI